MNPFQLRRRKRLLALWGPLVGILAASFLIALGAWAYITRTSTPEQRFRRAWGGGDSDVAERLAWEQVKQHPNDMRWWIWFIDAHAEVTSDSDDSDAPQPSVSEKAFHNELARLADTNSREVVSFFFDDQTKKKEPGDAVIMRLADTKPPVRWSNYVVARHLVHKKDWRGEAVRYEREGLAFRDRQSLRAALDLWVDHDQWTDVRKRLNDGRYAAAVDLPLRVDVAIHDRDWLHVLVWTWPATYAHVTAWPILLALIAATLWFRIATRLGRMGDGVDGRKRLYIYAFILGVLSIYPTLLTIMIEEDLFGLRELHQLAPDLIYYVFGVGLREEAWKTILFLPLVKPLLRRGSRIEAMTCGALVGLGFAAEENVSYFLESAGTAALPRFLTANFLHMSLTALVALSIFDTLRRRATPRDAFNVTFPLAVAIHGAYDFCLSARDLPLSSIISMVLLMIIAQRFLRQLLIASSREEERDALNMFVASMATIVGAAYVYATTIAGPFAAFGMIAIGSLSVIIVIYMFVRELSG